MKTAFGIALLFATCPLASGAPPTAPSVELASPFQDHMVLQRDMKVPVWGSAKAGATITISFAGQKQNATADADGKWRADLDPLTASSKPGEITVSSNSDAAPIVLKDVLVGEVWICSGQSNMQMTVDAVPNVKALISKAANIRSFEVKRTVAFTEQERCEGEWVDRYPNSAIAFSFAYFLREAADVPVGIILTAWGSSSLEAWMPRDMTATVPHYKTVMGEFDADTATHERIKAALDGSKPWSKKDDIFLRRQPNILYNAMMKPLAPYACRGVVWYQGERNTQSMQGMVKTPWFSRNSGMLIYGDVLKQWMLRYRKEWGRDDLEFLVVMLPGYGKSLNSKSPDAAGDPNTHSWAWMRESQMKALELPHTGVANTIDLGDLKNIHPKDKLPIGRRLALLATRDTLGREVGAEGPVMKNVEAQGTELIVHFDHAEGLKTIDNKAPTGFWIADKSATWVPADATIEGQTVVLRSSEIKAPLYVRYAFAGLPKVNLTNGINLPAYPFRNDSFKP